MLCLTNYIQIYMLISKVESYIKHQTGTKAESKKDPQRRGETSLSRPTRG